MAAQSLLRRLAAVLSQMPRSRPVVRSQLAAAIQLFSRPKEAMGAKQKGIPAMLKELTIDLR